MDGSTIAAPTIPTPSVTELLTRSVKREHAPMSLRVEGTLPASLEGTLYRTGPAVFEVGGRRVSHIFEGDGGVSSVRFGGGSALGAYKVIESEGRKRELAAGKRLYGFAAPWHERFRSAMKGEDKNTGNTNLLFHQGKLYALMEGAIPTELDKDSLATLGETRFDGTIVGAFSAHPHRIPKRRTTYNFGLRYGRETFIDLYALPDEGAPSRMGEIKLPAPVMLHDFIATENHLVFFVAPLRVIVWRAVLQAGTFAKMFEYEPSAGTEVIVVPIDRPNAPRRFTVDAFFQWHFANAFEQGDAIVVDFVRYPDAGSFSSIGSAEIGGGQLVRAEVGLTKDTLSMRVLEGSEGDFPLVDPRSGGAVHDVVFRTSEDTRGSGLSRFDVREGRASVFRDDHTRAYSEAIFVPKHASAKEGEGFLLSLVLDARTEKSHVAVLDAEHIEDGPIARAHFEHAIPITFHGTFVPG